jgi:hypothetical protein
MMRYTSLRKFKKHLITELGSVDEEVKVYALCDSKEHLVLLVNDIMRKDRKISKRKAFRQAVESFGYPSEIAEAYRNNL